jgi:hypothetical protein
MITIHKDVLSGATAQQIRGQTAGLAPPQLADLAVRLADHPDLSVSVITYDDGTQELEVLYTGPPHRTEDTIDQRKFSREPDATPTRTLAITSQADLQHALNLIRATLLDATAP